MEVKIKNGRLVESLNLLFILPLKGKQSRQRSKLVKILKDRLQEVEEQERELLKEHCHLDADGNPRKKNNDREWDVIDGKTFLADKKELYDEEIVLEGGNNTEMLKIVKEILLKCDIELSGPDAEAYDYLCEQFEIVED